jgi:osmotically inducible protein OsmC
MKRRSSAVWKGSGPEGSGTLSMQSGVFDQQPYSAKLRFQNEDGKQGTNPEELIAAAHAGCFSMALAFQLTNAGFEAEEIQTDAVLKMEKGDAGWSIVSITLNLKAKVPGIGKDKFMELAQAAKGGCPVSKVLNAEITLEARLEA